MSSIIDERVEIDGLVFLKALANSGETAEPARRGI